MDGDGEMIKSGSKLILFVLIFCALTLPAGAQTKTTVTGTLVAPDGTLATSGFVTFRLTPTSAAQLFTVSGTNILAPEISTCNINSSGVLQNSLLAGACAIWGNNLISPAGTAYNITIAPANQTLKVIQGALISGASVDLSSLTTVTPSVPPPPVPATLLSGTNVFTGVNTFSGGLTSTGSTTLQTTSVLSLNNIQFADRFAGADAGAKIIACVAALSSTGGTCDARGITGAQSTAATIALGANLQLLLAENLTLTGGAAANPIFSVGTGSSIIGANFQNCIIQTATAGNKGIDATGSSEVHLQGFQLLQTNTTPTNQGIVFNGGGDSWIRDVLVKGWQDGISITGYSQIFIEDTFSQFNTRDGLRLIGTITVMTNPYLDHVSLQNNSGIGLLIDGNVSGGSAVDILSGSNAEGVVTQTSLGTGTPSQLWFYDVQADSNTNNGWRLDTGNQLNLIAPWSANRGTGKNFKIGGVTNVHVTNPFISNFKGHGMEITAGATAIKIEGGFVNDAGANIANTFDGINMNNTGGAPVNVTVSNVNLGNANLRYAMNIGTGLSVYKLIGNQMTAGGMGALNDVPADATRVILGNKGVANFLPDNFSSLGITGNLTLGNISTISTSGLDNSLSLSQSGPLKVPTGNLVFGTTNTTTLNFPAPAAPMMLTFPSTADTMVGRATTDTLTNKTLIAPVLSGVNAQVGTTYTFVAGDEQKLVTFNNAAAVAVTLPAAGTTGFVAGTVFHTKDIGVGTATITPVAGTIDGASSLALATGQGADIYSDGSNYSTQKGSGPAAWSSLSPATAPLTLNNAGFSTEFDQTSPIIWKWKNTTAATSTVAQSSPLLDLSGNFWNGTASAEDLWSAQNVVNSGTNGASTLTFTHSGSTGLAGVQVPNLTVTGEAILTGGANPVLDYEPAAFTTSQFFDARPAPWQIIRGTTASPIGNGIPSILINQVSNGAFTSGTDTSSLNSGIKVHHVIAGGLTMNGASAGDFNLEDRVASNVRGQGPAAVHAEAISATATGDVFGMWSQAFDTGLASAIVGIEVDVDGTSASRPVGQTRGINVVGFPGTGTTAGSSGDISNDWGIIVQNFGNGILLDPGLPAYAASTRNLIKVRNSSNATGNANTTVLSFEPTQPGPFKNGVDFTNATFAGTGGCCSIVTGDNGLAQFGKIGTVVTAGSNNLAGACAFAAATSCTVTFNNPYVAIPICVVTEQGVGTVAQFGVTTSPTTLIINSSVATSATVNYICIAHPN